MADLPLDLTMQSTGSVKPVAQTSTNGHNSSPHTETPARTGTASYGEGLEVEPISPAEFDAKILLRAFRIMLTARRLDGKMLSLLKQGKGFFILAAVGTKLLKRQLAY